MAWRRIANVLFSKYLLLTNTVASGAMDGIGDILEQRLERIWPHDWGRTARMATVGLFLGPVDHFWYRFLDKRFPERRAITIGKKILVDMLINGPLSITGFYIGMCTLEKKSWNETVAELKVKFGVTYKLEWIFWPAAQMLNFYFLPPSLRVTYTNVVHLGWSMALSYLKHNTHPPAVVGPPDSDTCRKYAYIKGNLPGTRNPLGGDFLVDGSLVPRPEPRAWERGP